MWVVGARLRKAARSGGLGAWLSRVAMVACCVWICGASVPSAAAAQSQSEAPREAIELYRSGRAHYDAGRYREAIVDLKAALALDPESPNLVYNVARVSELLGNIDEAIAYYTRYVGMLSDADNDERERIRATIRRLEGARTELSERAGEQRETLREVIYRERPARGEADALFWIVGGAGVAMVATSIVTGVLAGVRSNTAKTFVIGEDGNYADRQNEVTQANNLALTTDLLVFGGVGALGAATLLYFLRRPEAPPEQRVQVSVAANADRGVLTVSGTF